MPKDFDPWGRPERKPQPDESNKPDRSSGGANAPPDLEEVLGKFFGLFGQKRGGPPGSSDDQNPRKRRSSNPIGILAFVAIAAVLVWFVLGFYVVDEQERGVVLRLGKFNTVLEPGLRWQPHLIDQVVKINVTRVREQQFDGEMLTEDENIVDVKTSVQYIIKSPQNFVLAIRNGEESLSLATDSALRHVVGSSKLDDVITTGREQVADEVQVRVQNYLDSYDSGLLISKVNILESKAPDEVKGAFDDVIKAREDKVRVINQATTYENGVIPEARGRAKRMLEEAAGYRGATIAMAEGEAERFSKLAGEYAAAPEVTRTRLYIQAIEQVLQNSSKVLVDTGEGGSNLLYLPLDQLVRGVRDRGQDSVGNMGSVTGSTSVQHITDQVLEELQRSQQRPNQQSGNLRQSRQ